MVRRLFVLTFVAGLAAFAWRVLRQQMTAPVPATAPSVNGALPTRDQLYREAQELDVPGRSRMNKEQLALAVRARREEVMSA
jgi:hypothetical protein